MELNIKKGQESKKGMLSGKNVKLTLEVTVSLSEQEKQLMERYYEPSISGICVRHGKDYIRAWYDGTDENFKEVKVDSCEGKMSKFHLIAHIDNGHNYLGNVQEFEKAVVRTLIRNMDYLKALSVWEGQSKLTSEEQLASEKAVQLETATPSPA